MDDNEPPKPFKNARPLLYGPDDKPLPSTGVNTNSSHKVSKKEPSKAQRAKRSPTIPSKRLPTFVRSLLSALLAVATLLGIVALYPRVSVTPVEDTGGSDPLHFPVTVSNNGQFEIYSATLTCTVDEFVNDSRHATIRNLTTSEDTELPIGTLAGGGYTTTACLNAVDTGRKQGEKIRAHLVLFVKFRPSFWPRIVTREFYVTGATEADGQIHWMRVSK